MSNVEGSNQPEQVEPPAAPAPPAAPTPTTPAVAPYAAAPPPAYGQPGYGQNQPMAATPSAAAPMTQSDVNNWSMAAHLSALVASFIGIPLLGPLVVLLTKGKDNAQVRRHAVESLNFQITAMIVFFVLFLSIFILIGFLLLPIYAVFWLVVVIMASVRSSRGEDYRYPLTLRLIS